MNHCETCRWRDAEGFCWNIKLTSNDSLKDEWSEGIALDRYSEGGGFWVGPRFGCVHWEEIV